MKKFILVPLAAAMFLAGCGTMGPSDYALYTASQTAAAEAAAAAQIARTQAIQQIASSGDATTKTVAVVMLQSDDRGTQAQQVQPPRSVGDTVFKWATLLVPSLTTWFNIDKNADVAIINSNNSLAAQQNSNATMVDLANGRAPVTTVPAGSTAGALQSGQTIGQ